MSRKKRLQMQSRPRSAPDVSVEIGDSPQAQRMLTIVQSIVEIGTYPCPECGTPVEYVGHDPTFGMHFRCPKPGCKYEAFWDWQL